MSGLDLTGALLDWAPLLLALVLVLGWYLSFSAARLDRLHHRVESSRAALDAQFVRRAAAAIEAAQVLDPASGLLIADAAAASLSLGEEPGTPARLEEAENDVTRALFAAFDDASYVALLNDDPLAMEALAGLEGACSRVQLARRFHNDAVAQAQRVRRKRVVRWARLAGHAPMPAMVEIDDSTPRGLIT